MKRLTKLKIGVVAMAGLAGIGAGYLVPRIQLSQKGYEKQEIQAIMDVDKEQRKLFFETEKIDDVMTWLSLSPNIERYQDYVDYQSLHIDMDSEEVKTTVDLILENPNIFIFTSHDTKKSFYAKVEQDKIEDYIKDTNANELMSNPTDIELLVTNKAHFSMSYVPSDLEKCAIPSSEDNEPLQYLRQEANQALKAMADDAKKEGYILLNNSSYRSYFDQEDIYDYYLGEYGQAYCDMYVGDPGYSEHQSGLAIDLSSESVQDGTYFVFGDSPDYDWVVAHCVDYGFILRYPEDKTEITNVANEPWHFRYVGKKAAEIMKENNWALEEYKAMN